MAGKATKEPKNRNTKETISAIKTDNFADEKELFQEAEKREAERKAEEEKAKAEAKKEAAVEKKSKKEIVAAEKQNIRRKPRHGKKYRNILETIEKGKLYDIDEAIELVKKTSITKFEATIELHVKLSKKLENVRGTLTLPGGAVKQKKVLEVTAKNIDDVVTKIKSGKIDFDIMVADPAVMPKLAGLAKILGPKGLMPNPKAGTVADDVAAAAEEFRSGRVEYKADKSNIVHLAIAKIKLDDEKIKQNIDVVLSQFPATRIDSVHINSTMGPSVRIQI